MFLAVVKVILFGVVGSLVGGFVGVVIYALLFMFDGSGPIGLLLAFGVMFGGIPGAVIGVVIGLVKGMSKVKSVVPR